YDWRGRVTKSIPNSDFELEISQADKDWIGTRVGFHLEESNGSTTVRFHHRGWPEINEHFRISCFCWAMYLRILRRYLEHGETVPYEKRLDV
ncbi:MAG: SRPBCC domain-containing protein, partial [Bacteroidota bacterium]